VGKLNGLHPRRKLRKARTRLDGRMKAWNETIQRLRQRSKSIPESAFRKPGSMKT